MATCHCGRTHWGKGDQNGFCINFRYSVPMACPGRAADLRVTLLLSAMLRLRAAGYVLPGSLRMPAVTRPHPFLFLKVAS
jgi:hypothetical protein